MKAGGKHLRVVQGIAHCTNAVHPYRAAYDQLIVREPPLFVGGRCPMERRGIRGPFPILRSYEIEGLRRSGVWCAFSRLDQRIYLLIPRPHIDCTIRAYRRGGIPFFIYRIPPLPGAIWIKCIQAIPLVGVIVVVIRYDIDGSIRTNCRRGTHIRVRLIPPLE